MANLTKTQAELLDAMRAGVRVFRSSDYPKYWWRNDNHKKCTATADALRERGLVRMEKPTK